MVSLVLYQQPKFSNDTTTEQKWTKRKHKAEKDTNLNLAHNLHKAVKLAQDKGCWLTTTLPLEEHGFFLTKSEFRDALCPRYGWLPDRFPSKCVYSEYFTIDHALSCPRGVFTTITNLKISQVPSSLKSVMILGGVYTRTFLCESVYNRHVPESFSTRLHTGFLENAQIQKQL
jgi:hypothetical protein